MAIFSPPPPQSPSFGSGAISSPLLGQALSLFAQTRSQRFQRERDERAEERYQQRALEADERSERRLLMSDELQQQRQIAAEERDRAQREQIARAELEAYDLMKEGLTSSLGAPNFSPIQETKVPFPELEGLTEEEVTSMLLRDPLLRAKQAAGVEGGGEPTLNKGGQVLLKQLMGEKPVRHWSVQHEAQLMDLMVSRASENLGDFPPEAVLGALERITKDVDRMRAQYEPLDRARDSKLDGIRDALQGYGPRPQISGTPQHFGLRVQNPSVNQAEVQEMPRAAVRLSEAASLGTGEDAERKLMGLFPDFAEANVPLQGAVNRAGFSFLPLVDEAGKITGFRVESAGGSDEQAMAQLLEREVNRTRENVVRVIGWIGKGAALDFDNLEDFGMPFLSDQAASPVSPGVREGGPAPEGTRSAAPQRRSAEDMVRRMLGIGDGGG